MASISSYDVDATVRKVKGTGMVNRILQQICAGEGLTKYGVKAELQQKIIDSEFGPKLLSRSLAAAQFHHRLIHPAHALRRAKYYLD